MVKINPEIESLAGKTVNLIRERIPVEAAYLFGSHTTGVADENSDIDLAAFCHGIENMDIDEKITLIAQVQIKIAAPVEIHLFDSSRIKEARPSNLYGLIIKTGKKIY